MRCMRCGVCCQETDMLLSEADISSLENQGFTRDFFVRYNSEGYALLKNRQGCCIFFNPSKRHCEVYLFRPLGCRVYPVIQDDDSTIIVDSICRAQKTINETEKRIKGKKVTRLLEKIDLEAKKRSKR